MVGTSSAVNILLDVVFTIQGTTGGDDGNPTRTPTGSPLTIKVDEVKISQGKTVSDHGTAQSAAEFNRATKLPESVRVETKLEKKESAALLGLLQSAAGQVVEFTATAVGASIEGIAIVADIEWDYDGPSSLAFNLRQYGTVFTVSNT